MPHHNTYRRILAYKIFREEIEQFVRTHHAQRERGGHYGVDGKAVHGTRQVDELRGDHLLSVYDIQEGKVLAQREVDCKENEIVVAPKGLSGLDLSRKLISADAMRTLRAFSASTGRDWSKCIAWSVNSTGCGRERATNKPAKSNMELSVSLVQKPRFCKFSNVVASIDVSKLVCIARYLDRAFELLTTPNS